MRLIRSARRRWTCHWSSITSRTADGREIRTPVWICEYPYRTMMASPCSDCEGCRTAAAELGMASRVRPDETLVTH